MLADRRFHVSSDPGTTGPKPDCVTLLIRLLLRIRRQISCLDRAILENSFLKKFNGHVPIVAADAFVAEGARLVGEVLMKAGASVWFNAVLRADSEPITIGEGSNVQDNCSLHVDPGFPCVVGRNVTIGHNAVVHGCTIEDNVIVGMHATVLNGAVIGGDSIVGANALVTENARIPAGSLVVGVPGKVARPLRPDEIASISSNAQRYVDRARAYRSEFGTVLGT